MYGCTVVPVLLNEYSTVALPGTALVRILVLWRTSSSTCTVHVPGYQQQFEPDRTITARRDPRAGEFVRISFVGREGNESAHRDHGCCNARRCL